MDKIIVLRVMHLNFHYIIFKTDFMKTDDCTFNVLTRSWKHLHKKVSVLRIF